jgi:hypothetical protein
MVDAHFSDYEYGLPWADATIPNVKNAIFSIT